jgi:hypothetical protein
MSEGREFKDGKADCALCLQQTSTSQASQQSSPVRARPTRYDKQPRRLAWCCPWETIAGLTQATGEVRRCIGPNPDIWRSRSRF